MIKRRRQNGGKRSRRGITIIELLIVVTCVAAALGLCAVTIQLLLRLQSDAQARYLSQVGLDRLARQLRGDSHAAASAEVDAARPGKAAILNLTFRPKHSVTYEPRKSAVMRAESRDGKIVHRELFALPAIRAIQFELKNEEGRQFVVLLATRSIKPSDRIPDRPLQAVALLGKDRAGAVAIRGGPPP